MSESSTQGKTPRWEALLHRYWAWLLVGLTILVVLTVRVRLREMPLERDEGEYAYAGQLILQGIPPYKDAYNMKLPGTYAAYAVIMAVFGQTPSGIHLGVAVVNVASIVLVFLIGRKLLDEAAGVAAAAVFALMSLSPSVLGLAGHATHFVALFALAGLWFLLRAPPLPSPTKQPTNSQLSTLNPQLPPPAKQPTNSQLSTLNSQLPFLYAGLCLGLAFLMKQHGVFFGVFGVLFLCWRWIEPRLPRDNRAVEAKVRWKMSNLARKDGPEMAAKARQRQPAKAPVAPAAPTTRATAATATAVTPAPGKRLSLMAQDKLKAKDDGLRTEDHGPLTEDHGPQTGDRRLETADPKPPSPAKQPTNPQPSTLNSQLSSPAKQPTASQLSTLNSQLSADCRPETGDRRPETSDPKPPSPAKQPTNPQPSTLNSQLPSLSSLAIQLLFLGAGLALPFLLTCLTLWIAGVFPQFWFWTISYASEYAVAMSGSDATKLFQIAFRSVVAAELTFWILGLAGAAALWWDWRLKLERKFLLMAFLLCSIGSVTVGLYFREHYFITLLPALALLAGVAVSRAAWLLRNDRSIELVLAGGILLLFAIGIGAPFIGHGVTWMSTSPEKVVQQLYSTTLFGEAENVADFIERDSDKNTRIAVLGSEPEIYFYANRRSATGYIYTYPLMERQEFARRMQEEMIAEIERAEPEYVVYVNEFYSWLQTEHSDTRIFDWWSDYWPKHMMLVQTVPVVSQTEAELLPGPDGKMREGRTTKTGNVMVFKRK